MKLSRRSVLRGSAVALAAPALDTLNLGALPSPAVAQSEGDEWRHGLSLFGDVKYPAGFKHFEYVNPNAPKGGIVRMIAVGTFDNFNMAVSGVRGSLAAGVTNLLYSTLMADAMDEVSTEYGLLAESVKHPPDFSSVTYRLRANARWHDGRPVSVEDVIFSLEAFKKHHPQFAAYYRHVTKAEKTGERDVTFTFDSPGNRELPLIVGQLFVLPKHWWEGADANGNKRDIGQTRLEAPLGSGPYRVKSFTAGRTLVYERVNDYWGKDVNVNVGRDNFDEIRFEYFRDPTIALEAFRGDNIDWRTENSALNWATRYDFPARHEKRVILDEFPIRNQGVMQAFVFNMRRAKFSDWRVRRAFNYAFDFDEMNKQLFFGQYTRIASYFEGTELASRGLPEGEELAILETVRGKVPPEVFTTPYTNPTSGSPEQVRANLREGLRLLKDAGWEIRDRRLVSVKTKEPMTIEFLTESPTFERVFLFYKPALERLGVTVTARTVDDAQYENRLRSWDYDAVIGSWGQSLSPGNEQRGFWGSAAADQPGSRNLIGIKDEAVDALIERVIFAKNRSELVAATKALDRVLLHHNFVVPQWTYGKQRTARWDRFGRPDDEKMPRYGAAAFPTIWWWDAQRAAKTGSRQ
jgi:microcin C transport system substrate-binding protein